MNVFAFASHTETQGMVLTEAMAAGVPVVALDAPGVREVVRDRVNGRLLVREDAEEFAGALAWIARLSREEEKRLREEARKTAGEFSMSRSARLTLALYYSVIQQKVSAKRGHTGRLSVARRRIAREWEIIGNLARAASSAVLDG
jgi:glycosyltransferase involved in cell wall biosynthesis